MNTALHSPDRHSLVLHSRCAFARLVWVWQQFRAATAPITTLQLAMEYEVSSKTIDRDIDVLRNFGCQIVTVRNPHGSGYIGSKLANPDFCPWCQLNSKGKIKN